MPDNNELSERELEILRLVATGASNKEIAQRLTISTNTVKVHLRNIFGKIGAASRTEAAMYAVNSGLVQVAGQNTEEIINETGVPKTDLKVPRSMYRIWILTFFAVVILSLVGMTGYLAWNETRVRQVNLQPTIAQAWLENASMPTARFGLAISVYDNYVYTIAGETDKSVSGIVERYDPRSNSWIRLKDKPTAVSAVSAAVLAGKIYVPGGRSVSGKPIDALEIYDPRSDTWSEGANLPISLCAYTLVSFEGKLYLFGGWDGNNYLGVTYEYDIDKDAWTRLPDMPTPRADGGAAVAGRKIYVIGGYNGKEALSVNEAFLPDRSDDPSNAWQDSKPMPSAGYGMGVTSVAETIYSIGGMDGKGNPLPAFAYVPESEEWRSLEEPPTQIGSHLGLVSFLTYLYAIGGEVNQHAINDNLSYKAIYTILLPLLTK